MPYDPLKYPDDEQKMTSPQIFQIFVFPGLTLLLGMTSMVFFAPPINTEHWVDFFTMRVILPTGAIAGIEYSYWYFHHKTFWILCHEILESFTTKS